MCNLIGNSLRFSGEAKNVANHCPANDGQKIEKPPKINVLGGFDFTFSGLV